MDGFVCLFESHAAQSQSPDLQNELLLRAANIYEEQLQDPDKSARTLERLLLLGGDQEDALRRLKEFYEAKGDARKLATVLPNLIEIETDDESRNRLRFQYAEIAQGKLRNPNIAFEVLRELFEENPYYEGARTLLIQVGKNSRQWQPVAILLAHAANAAEDAPSTENALSVTLELASIYIDKLNDESEAIKRYQQASN